MRVIACSLFTLILVVAPLSAGSIIGNLPPSGETMGSQVGYNAGATVTKALGFTMGGQDYSLAGAVLRLECNPNTSSTCEVLQSISLTLLTDFCLPHTPDALLTAFNYSFSLPLPTTWASYNFSPVAGTTLIHGMTYWLALSGSISPAEDNNALLWSRSDPMATPAGPGATFFGGRLSVDGGANWGTSSVANSFELMGSRWTGVSRAGHRGALRTGSSPDRCSPQTSLARRPRARTSALFFSVHTASPSSALSTRRWGKTCPLSFMTRR